MKSLHPKKRTTLFPGISIQQRLPLLICILMLSIVIAVGYASYLGVKKTSLTLAGERLKSLTEQLGTMFGQSMMAGAMATRAVANMPLVTNYVKAGVVRRDTAVVAALRLLQTDTQSLYVELLNSELRPILRAGRPGIEVKVDRKTVLSDLPVGPDSARTGKIYRVNDSMYYPIIATVTSNKQTIGYVVRWRLFFVTPEQLAQFSALLGTNAVTYMGNSDGKNWTDMLRPAEPPPVNILRDSGDYYSYSRPKGEEVIAMIRPIVNTPLLLLLEFPQKKILEGTKRFVSWILIIGGIITAIGIGIAWIMSRNITKPLKNLTAAATAVADGNYTATVEVDRKDELGELARSFNSMALKISDAQQDLEKKVKERTVQLETVNKELEAFSYSVSHDLRAPLRAISGYAAILREDYAGKLDPEACRLTDTIVSKAKMMGQLIDDLIDFSKTGAKEIVDQQVAMKTLAESCVVELLSHEATSRYQVQIGNLPDCRGDQNLFRQVWMNLIGNAIKYSSQTGKPAIEIGSKEDSSSYTYFIQDNGVGFDMRYVDKLFGVFQRLHTDEAFKGTGIGLALVKRIITKYNGDVWAKAEPGQGAAFYFSLPK